jgi:CheY-like chemotaxis protein
VSLKILLADDSMTAQNMGKKILVDGGYEVVAVSNGAAAVKKLAEFTPDLVIADVYMPGYNGLEICERIKKSNANIPVLLSVGKLEPFRPEEGLKVHADGIIIKPFEASDLLAVTAKLAERVGKVAPQTASAPDEQEEENDVAVEEAELAEPVMSATVDEAAVIEPTADLPAFGVEEFSPAPAPTFAAEEQQPDYVREFGLDPHDAPTTMFRLPLSAKRTAAEPSFTNEFAALEEFQPPVAEFEPMVTPPASLNMAINDAFSPEPEAQEVKAEPAVVAEAEVAHDDFEAKLAAAMAEYEPPAGNDTEAVELVTVVDPEAAAEVAAPVEEFTAFAPVWTAEEAPLTAEDHAVNLEQEFRAFAAVASGGTAARPALAPIGPLGDTSADDEIMSMVEESKERFFPNAVMDDMHLEAKAAFADLPVTEDADEFVALEIGGPLADPNAREVAQFDNDWGVSALEDDAMLAEPNDFAEPDTAIGQEAGTELPVLAEAMDDSNDFAAFNQPDVPELMTHDVPTEWNSGVVLDEVTPEMPASQVAEEEHALFTDEDFVCPEAPFAHAAVEEVVAEQPISAKAEMFPATMHEAMADEVVAPEVVASVVSEVSENFVAASAQTAPTLDRHAISEAVERVMERMKTDLVAQIANELAAKLGK